MAKRENVLEKLIGKTKRPEGELEAIDRRLHENTARCFDEVLSLLLDSTGEYTKALLGGGRGSMKSSTASLGISAGLEMTRMPARWCCARLEIHCAAVSLSRCSGRLTCWDWVTTGE